MNLSEILQMAPRLLTLLAQLIIFFICLSYLIRNNTTDSILLFMGALLSLLTLAFGTLMFPFFIDYIEGQNVQFYFGISNSIGFIGKVIFAIGLYLCIDRVLK